MSSVFFFTNWFNLVPRALVPSSKIWPVGTRVLGTRLHLLTNTKRAQFDRKSNIFGLQILGFKSDLSNFAGPRPLGTRVSVVQSGHRAKTYHVFVNARPLHVDESL